MGSGSRNAITHHCTNPSSGQLRNSLSPHQIQKPPLFLSRQNTGPMWKLNKSDHQLACLLSTIQILTYFLSLFNCIIICLISNHLFMSQPAQTVIFNGTYVYFKPCEYQGTPDPSGSIDLTFNIGEKEFELFNKVAANVCEGTPILSCPLWTNKMGITSVKAKIFNANEHIWAKHLAGNVGNYGSGSVLAAGNLIEFYNNACRVTGTIRKNKQGKGGWTLYFQCMELNPTGQVIPYSAPVPMDFDAVPELVEPDEPIPAKAASSSMHAPKSQAPKPPRAPIKINVVSAADTDATSSSLEGTATSPPWTTKKNKHHLARINNQPKRATTPRGSIENN